VFFVLSSVVVVVVVVVVVGRPNRAKSVEKSREKISVLRFSVSNPTTSREIYLELVRKVRFPRKTR